ncbi:ThiF family adenylyltransferase [Paenibacillus sp. GCM10027626]|uniref:ThiF family adenylyltransferase n=1 Tax=Paenibacillus sp. GCM10027626 TaxID=3273411 RepID=UPI003645806B
MAPNDNRWSERYSRQIRFAPIGLQGQERLQAATVLIVGCGALGASLAQHMARAGIGTIRIVDRDFVEPSNLQRQMLFDEADALAMLPKTVAAANKLRQINSEVSIEPHVANVTAANVSTFVSGAALVLDGTDNAETRYVMSDACFQEGIPLFYGGIAGAHGMCAALVPGESACLRCLVGEESEGEQGETCDTIGVISPIVDWIAAMQAAEALKWLTGNSDMLRRTWLTVNLWPFRLYEAALPSAVPACPHCGYKGDAAPALPPAGSPQATAICGRDSVQVAWASAFDLTAMKQRFAAANYEVTINPYLLKIHIPAGEKLVLFPDGRVLVQGTSDAERALVLCGQYLPRQQQSGAG